MSSIARWSYTELAEIKPVLAFDALSQKDSFGEPYQIKCSWQDMSESIGTTSDSGEPFVARRTYSTEDARPKFGDLIRPISPLAEGEDWGRIEKVEKFPMSMFGKNEKPDFGLVT